MEAASKRAITPSSVVQDAAEALKNLPDSEVESAVLDPSKNFVTLLRQDWVELRS